MIFYLLAISIIPLLYPNCCVFSQNVSVINGSQAVFYENGLYHNLLFNFTITNQLTCKFQNNVTESGYCDAKFVINPSSSIVEINSRKVGRGRNYECSDTTGTKILGSLIIKPDIRAFVCDKFIGIRDSMVSGSLAIKFSDRLIEAGTVSCRNVENSYSISKSIVPNELEVSIPMSFNQSNSNLQIEIFNCTFKSGTFGNDFLVNMEIENANFSFTQSTVVSDKSQFSLYLRFNFQPSQNIIINCTLVQSPLNPSCSSSNITSKSNWTITNNLELNTDNVPPSILAVEVKRITNIPGTQQTFVALCCSNNKYGSVSTITINNPEIDKTVGNGSTTYNDVRYFELSSCPCDLTVDTCDTNCCCDSFCDCSNSSTSAITGPYGGFFNSTPSSSCYYPNKDLTPPYHSLLCVEYESSSVLSDYYSISSIISQSQNFDTSKASAISRNPSFQFTSVETTKTSTQISTTTNSLFGVPQRNPSLTLPRSISGSAQCNLQTTISFYDNYQSTCTERLNSCNSSVEYRFNPRFYLLSTTALSSVCNNTISISALQSSIQVFTFYKCQHLNTSCSFDDGFTVPSVIWNRTCNNIVQSVDYKLYINNTNVIYIEATILLISSNIGTDISQKFSVSFTSTSLTFSLVPVLLTSSTTTTTTSSTTTPKSGLYGYDLGKPVLTAPNNTNITTWNYIKIPTNTNGLCTTTQSSATVNFGSDVVIQCKHKLRSTINCSVIQFSIMQYFDSIITDELVAVYGNPQNANDFVAIYNTSVSNDLSSIYNAENLCLNAYPTMLVRFYYSRQGKVQDQFINNIRGVKKSYVTSDIIRYQPNGADANPNDLITISIGFIFQRVTAGITGDQNTDDITFKVCLFDVCFDELMYPWMFDYEGRQVMYDHAFGIVLLSLALFVMATTYPWW